jgi:molecular chaperone GrpE
MPAELKDNKWAQGVLGLSKNLDKALSELQLSRIDAKPGTPFDPNLHEAVMMDQDAEGKDEIVDEELRAGYMMGNTVIRPSMVRVTKS